MKKKYLLFGDSGSGKSSFVKSLGGKDLEGNDPEVGGKGDSVTTEPKIYIVNDELLGTTYFIDTKGTHDPSEWNNDTIIENLVKALSDLSVLGMKEDLQANQSLDGIIFVSADTHRFYRTNNLTQLSSRLGVEFEILNKSTITLQTKYNMLQGETQEEVEEMLRQKHDNNKNLYTLWDSIKPVPYQKKLLAAGLANLTPIQLVDLDKSNENILLLARQLQQQDLVLKNVKNVREIVQHHKENIEQLTTVEEKIVLTPEIPNFGFVGNIISYISDKHVKVQEEHPNIYVKFPKTARQPKVIKGYQIQYTEQNAELIKHSIEIKGDYVEAHFQYKYKKVNQGNISRIDIRLDFEIKYYELREYTTTGQEAYQEDVMLPRYDDEKPYIQEAQKQLLKQILERYTRPKQQIE